MSPSWSEAVARAAVSSGFPGARKECYYTLVDMQQVLIHASYQAECYYTLATRQGVLLHASYQAGSVITH